MITRLGPSFATSLNLSPNRLRDTHCWREVLTVTAKVGTFTTNPGFALTNLAGVPSSITATGGTPQTTAVNTAFANPLQATVNDSFGNPVAGATVTFTAPTGGASGTFAGGVNTANTNSAGVATSTVFTANGTAGSYTVTGENGGGYHQPWLPVDEPIGEAVEPVPGCNKLCDKWECRAESRQDERAAACRKCIHIRLIVCHYREWWIENYNQKTRAHHNLRKRCSTTTRGATA